MIVFQVKGRSHRLSTLKGKVAPSTRYTEDTEALGRQLSQARLKPDEIERVRTAHHVCVHMMCTINHNCAHHMHTYIMSSSYTAQQHRAGQIISPLTLQTITIAQMLSVGGRVRLGVRHVASHSLRSCYSTINRSWVQILLGDKLHNNFGQVVHT